MQDWPTGVDHPRGQAAIWGARCFGLRGLRSARELLRVVRGHSWRGSQRPLLARGNCSSVPPKWRLRWSSGRETGRFCWAQMGSAEDGGRAGVLRDGPSDEVGKVRGG